MEPLLREQITDGHQQHHREAQVVAGKISRHEAGQNSQRRAAFLRRSYYFFDVARFNRSKNFHQFRNDGARERSARDDRSELPPLSGIATQVGNDEPRSEKRQRNGNKRGNPNERSERRLEV